MPAIVIIFIAAFFPVLLSTVSAVKKVNSQYMKVAQNFEIKQPYLITKIIFPASFPYIANGLHIAVGTAWIFLVAGEMGIDRDGFYPEDVMRAVGKKTELLKSDGVSDALVYHNGTHVVRETAKYCMTTGFNFWCHMAALTYVRKSDSPFLKKEVLPGLENGDILGGAGLSNPMKFYAGLDKIYLKAERVSGGFKINGALPFVSNLGVDHWFGVIGQVGDSGSNRVMALISCKMEGLKLKEKLDFIGLNGSATYTCQFKDVFVPSEQIIRENADSFIEEVRPAFVLYQLPLGFGVIHSAIQSIEKAVNKQQGCNQYLPVQGDDIAKELAAIEERFEALNFDELETQWKSILQLRLDTVYLTLKAVQTAMIHQGGAAYIQNSDCERRLREAYFFANLTPTIKHLEKMLS